MGASFRVGTALIALPFAAGSAVAHPGHEGSIAEPGTWFVYGPVLLGVIVVATTAGLWQERLPSQGWALLAAASGVALLAFGAFRWIG